MKKFFLAIIAIAFVALIWWLSAPKSHAQEAKPVPYHKFCVDKHGKEVRCPQGRLICTDPQKKKIDCKVFDEGIRGAVQSDPITTSAGTFTFGVPITGGGLGVTVPLSDVATTTALTLTPSPLDTLTITSISQLQINNGGKIYVDVKPNGAVILDKSLRGACSPDRLIAALESAHGFISSSADSLDDFPYLHQRAYLLSLTSRESIDLGEMHERKSSPEAIQQKRNSLKYLRIRLGDLDKRQSDAIETFNQVYKECIKK